METTRWSDDFDLANFHKRTIEALQDERKKTYSHKQQELVDEILEKMKNESRIMNVREHNEIAKQLQNVTEDIERIREGEEIKKFAQSVKQIISDYKELGPKLAIGISKTENKEILEKRKEYIREYSDLLGKYTNRSLIEDIKEVIPCDNCEGLNFEDVGDSEMCIECYVERPLTIKGQKHDTISKSQSNKHADDRAIFIKMLEKYQGRKSPTMPSELFTRLETYFKKKGIDKEKNKWTRDQMDSALQGIGHAPLVDDISYICHIHWKTPLPVISSDNVRLIINDYDEFAPYDEIVRSMHGKIMNRKFRMRRHLEKRGLTKEANDFKELKTEEVDDSNWRMWSDLIQLSRKQR